MADEYYSSRLDIPSSTVLITGGSSGIGFGLARCFVQMNAVVIITGRREQQLKEAANELNQLGKKNVIYHVNDVNNINERQALYKWIVDEYPQTNVLINNAGIQQAVSVATNDKSAEDLSWEEQEKTIRINLSAPMHLSYLFIQHFRQMNVTTAIINVSSGLAFVPLASISIYSATKAALHSFTMSLRYQMMKEIKNIQVYEIIPPAVQTNLGGGQSFGEPLDEYCRATFASLLQGQQEIAYKMSETMRKLISREQVAELFMKMNDNLMATIQDPSIC
ncbi:unnamed protein product [Adineta ricciae]|uniref:Uncharacterized protein n=1 Tax=Adineta ricciae TaxID=249248 RepID=A0A815EV89_ADIRI|nr:unnamed protein product [Adineta ricciae]CAF1315226.1 unnamed protein product [Adineta ricciae]